MDKLLALLRLIRAGNLVFIVLTQYFIRWYAILPVLELHGHDPILSELQYAMLVISTVFIGAAGYIVNDYFDVEIDQVNKPDKVIVNNIFSYAFCMRLQLALNVVGILLGMLLSWQIGSYKLGMLFVVITAFLWFYSMSLKRMFFAGNLVVSLCTAMVVVMPGIFEVTPLIDADYVSQIMGGNIMYIITGYMVFAFLGTLIREVVKDIQDLDGDLTVYASTIPAVLGVSTAKVIAIVFWLTFIGLLGYVQVIYLQQEVAMEQEVHMKAVIWIQVAYIAVTLQLPSLIGVVLLLLAKERSEFGRVSLLLKVIILMGIFSLPVFSYLGWVISWLKSVFS